MRKRKNEGEGGRQRRRMRRKGRRGKEEKEREVEEKLRFGCACPTKLMLESAAGAAVLRWWELVERRVLPRVSGSSRVVF